jgi:hypothetical protein
MMHDPDTTVGRLTELKALGLRLAVDDRGLAPCHLVVGE